MLLNIQVDIDNNAKPFEREKNIAHLCLKFKSISVNNKCPGAPFVFLGIDAFVMLTSFCSNSANIINQLLCQLDAMIND